MVLGAATVQQDANDETARDLERFMEDLVRRTPGEVDFHQAVREFAEKVFPFVALHPQYARASVLERLTEPDRVIMFRVTWDDDAGGIQVNRGYRVQFNNSIGPYKGGLRFDPSVTLGLLKALAFEQTLKNSLTTLPMGGAKGGSDFYPKGRSDQEIMRFCQAFMVELCRHIGPDVDVPAGDIGVGPREIGFLFGHYKRLRNEFAGSLTGKGVAFGGSLIRTEATGYGAVYFAREVLALAGDTLEGKRCLVSGSGNVAQYTAQKLIDLGARVLTLSDRDGFLYDPDGLDLSRLDDVIRVKTLERGSLRPLAGREGATFHEGTRPWMVPCDIAFPCATQNEIHADDARALVQGGCRLVVEGANMPTTYEAIKVLEQARVLLAPGKAANAGGVAISGLEMTQNAMRLTWTREQVDRRLREIMRRIHAKCVEYGTEDDGRVDYVRGANVAGFLKVADAMVAYGAV
jgi:glutamate dehydrogenase (NADP+)